MIRPMTEHRWFVPRVAELADFTEEECAFAAALSAATAGLVVPDVSDILIPGAYSSHNTDIMVAGLELLDDSGDGRPPTEFLDLAVHYSTGRVLAGRLDVQLYLISEQTPSLAMEATGTIASLADRTAQWFDRALRRPVVLYVWLHHRHVYAARYAFGDTSETLYELYNKRKAPWGQYRKVIAADHVRGRLQTTGLPTPDLYIPIRGDESAAKVPAGVRRSGQRGTIDGTWYE